MGRPDPSPIAYFLLMFKPVRRAHTYNILAMFQTVKPKQVVATQRVAAARLLCEGLNVCLASSHLSQLPILGTRTAHRARHNKSSLTSCVHLKI